MAESDELENPMFGTNHVPRLEYCFLVVLAFGDDIS